MFESALRRTILQDKFELTFVAPSQVLVKELQESAGENVLIESQLGLEIYDVRIMGRFFLELLVLVQYLLIYRKNDRNFKNIIVILKNYRNSEKLRLQCYDR